MKNIREIYLRRKPHFSQKYWYLKVQNKKQDSSEVVVLIVLIKFEKSLRLFFSVCEWPCQHLYNKLLLFTSSDLCQWVLQQSSTMYSKSDCERIRQRVFQRDFNIFRPYPTLPTWYPTHTLLIMTGTLDFYRPLFDLIKLSYRMTSRLMPTLKCFPFLVIRQCPQRLLFR